MTILTLKVQAQDSLPQIKVTQRGSKVVVSWNNPLTDIVQINVQRSYDSLKGFKTVHSVADPKAVSNGFVDNKPPDLKQFYRVYVQQERGKYFFSSSSRPYRDTARAVAKSSIAKKTSAPQAAASHDQESLGPVDKKPVKNSNGRRKLSAGQDIDPDSLAVELPEQQHFNAPSIFVYTNPQGHVVVALPPEKVHQYTLKFFKDDGSLLFSMNKIREPYLTIDKTNFMRSGWFRFELYENNVLKEKNKLFIPRENL
jgi:hypothetical protein